MATPYYTKFETDFKDQEVKENIQIASNGIRPFDTLADANTYYTNNPPAEDALFLAFDTNKEYTRYASTNTNSSPRDREPLAEEANDKVDLLTTEFDTFKVDVEKDYNKASFEAERHPWLGEDSEPNNVEAGLILNLGTLASDHTDRVFIRFLANNTTHSWIGVYNDSNVLVAQYRNTSVNPTSGTQKVLVKEIGVHPLLRIDVLINWDKLAGIEVNTETKLYIDTTVPYSEADYVSNDTRITTLEETVSASIPVDVLPYNPFGVLPSDFRTKLHSMDKDLEIVVVGDSIAGQIDTGQSNPNPQHSLAGWLADHWSFRLWDYICHNKPIFDRLDSQRNAIDVFTKIGTWSYITGGKFNTTPDSNSGEFSTSDGLYQSNDTNAEIQFSIDTDSYEKFNIVHGLHPDATNVVVSIAEGDNQFEASIDKSLWSEANGFIVNQKTESSESISVTGYAFHQRNRRIWFRKKAGVTGTKNVTFKKTTSNTDYIYFWGIEKWNNNTILLTNIGRGGRTIERLNRNITDVIDRNPDLVIMSMPLNNDTDFPYTTIESDYENYFYGGDNVEFYKYERSLFFKSNQYQDFSVLALLPTGRSSEWNGNNAVLDGSTDILPYNKFKKVYNYLNENNTFENLKIINIYDHLIFEAKARGLTVEDALTSEHFTVDGVHLSQVGSDLYLKYLAGLFSI